MLRTLIDEAWRAARNRWPAVALSADAFEAHVVGLLPRDSPAVALQQLRTDDLYLACACARGEPQAIAAFEREYVPVVDRALARLRVSSDAIAEVKQRVRCRALVGDGDRPAIAAFRGRGDLRGWLRVIATREALGISARADRELAFDADDRLHAFVMPDDPGRAHMTSTYRASFASGFERALRDLRPRDHAILRQYVVDGLTMDQLGLLYGVHRATAARMVERIRRTLLAATRAHMRAELEVGSTELSSILRAVRSQLDITLRGLRRSRRRAAAPRSRPRGCRRDGPR